MLSKDGQRRITTHKSLETLLSKMAQPLLAVSIGGRFLADAPGMCPGLPVIGTGWMQIRNE
jgi:hypothetical protein